MGDLTGDTVKVDPDGPTLSQQAFLAAFTGTAVVLATPTPAFRWDAERTGVWVDATTMLVTQHDGGLRRFHIGGTAPEPFTVPGLAPGVPYSLVPRLS